MKHTKQTLVGLRFPIRCTPPQPYYSPHHASEIEWIQKKQLREWKRTADFNSWMEAENRQYQVFTKMVSPFERLAIPPHPNPKSEPDCLFCGVSQSSSCLACR